MRKQTFGVGLIGFGIAGRIFHAPLIQATPGLELLAVVSSSPERVHEALPEVEVLPKAAALFARSDIDLVVIASPNETHFPLAKAAMAAGKHLVIDKPFTVSLSEARLLKAEADKAECRVSVFHNRRWDSDFRTLQALIEAGAVGRPVALELRFDRFRPKVADRWREQQKPGSGIWYDLGSHLLDQARTLFGMPRAILLDLMAARDDAQVDDDFHALLDYEDLRVTLRASSLVAEPTPQQALHGTRGSFVKYGRDPQENWLREGRAPTRDWGIDPRPGKLSVDEGEGETVALTSREHAGLPGDYLAYYAGIVESLAEGTPPPVTVEEAIEVMTLLEAGLDSYRQDRWIRLKENNGTLRKLLHRRGA
ncbi:oxidoreductase [Halomonas sp. MCCC 1A17488]|uniref:oxidoreductase n=1 Tax=unclassified Halomonas TaxID=2609666 RepID=UPI0018D2184A|nr:MULTISPECIES: oxidoreductase [unclassified Halomonas]MCE8018138.1 oxidoreductase [Halomonas sp. MCCC 1A17488]MCG3241471.1 oxidoreductase [Halomonas sp. MCCC 1A17488]QPP48571.1 oxidoreductase [Halomonas sp. SS10-MC5]